MSREQRRFARVYYDDLEKDFPAVFFDPTCFSTYVRLLVGADKSWPSLPELPKAIRRADLQMLTSLTDAQGHTLISLEPAGRYSVLGYAKDRGARESHARKGGIARWQNGGADAVA